MRAVLIVAVSSLLLWAPHASAAGYRIPVPVHSNATPAGYRVSPGQAIAVANRSPGVREQRARGRMRASVAQLPAQTAWEVSYYRGGTLLALATVDGRVPRVDGPVWTGPKALWSLARGIHTKFGPRLAAAVIALSILFLAVFFDPRRPFRMLHLDVLAFAAFSVTLLLFNGGHLYTSVPLQYVPLIYLLARLLWVGLGRSRRQPGPLCPLAPSSLLIGAILVLIVARAASNLLWGAPNDVAFAGVFGADSLHHGWNLYGHHPGHLDTYGPVNYFLYLPFEYFLPLGPSWTPNGLMAARALSLFFDGIVVVLLTLIGRRLVAGPDGRRLGLVLAYAWVACPMTFLPLVQSTNDILVPVFVLAALLALATPLVRGTMLGLGAAAKFAPVALIPLFARGARWSRRDAIVTVLAAAAVVAITFLPYVHQTSFSTVWHATLGFQLRRESPFTLWGLHPSLQWLQAVAKALAVAVLAVTLLAPGRRTLPQVAALSAAVILVLQMAGNYWSHTYVSWFAGPAFIGLFAAASGLTRAPADGPEHARSGQLTT